MSDRGLRVLASAGLAVGGVFGMAGTFAPSAALRGIAWGIDGVALVLVATFVGWIARLLKADASPGSAM
jgi:hypothetical protein